MGKSTVRVGSIVIDVDNFAQMMTFWQEALGYAPGKPPTPDDSFVILKDPTGKGLTCPSTRWSPIGADCTSTYTRTTRTERSNGCFSSAPPSTGLASLMKTSSSSRTPRATSSVSSTRGVSWRTGGENVDEFICWSWIAAGMADVLELVVRFAHIASAILWIGGLGFSVMVLRSAISRVGMAARKDTMLQLIPLANRFIPRVGISTVLLGTILYLMMGNLDPQNLWGTTWGRAMLAALTLSLGLLVYGIGYVRRAAERMLKHLNEENCTHGPEVAALQMTSSRGQVVALAWGFVILILMVVATGGL